MRRAVAIVLTTFIASATAHAGHGSGKTKLAKPARKLGVKFVVDKVNKHGQVVEREVVIGPIGRTRGAGKTRKDQKSRELTVDQQAKAMAREVDVAEIDGAMPDSLTLKGRLEETESMTSSHNGSTLTRVKLERTGAYHRGTAVETRVYARGKVRRIRALKGARQEPQMLGKGGSLREPAWVEVPASAEDEDGNRQWGTMSGGRLDYLPSRPYSVLVYVTAGNFIPVDRELMSQALRTGSAGAGDLTLRSDGEHVILTAKYGEQQQEYRVPHEQMKGFLQASYRSVPRGDEARWVDLGSAAP